MTNLRRRRHNWRPLAALQLEAADCGYICASVLAAMHGYAHTVESLKLRCGISNRGLTPTQLKRLMETIALPCEAISITTCGARNSPRPCIALTSNSHYIVVGRRRGSRNNDVFDPENGWRLHSDDELDALLQGIVLRIRPNVPFGSDRPAVPPIWQLFKGLHLGSQAGMLLLLSLVSLGAQITLPYLAGSALDSVVGRQLHFSIGYFAAVYLAIAVGGMFSQGIASYQGAMVGAHINRHLGKWLFARLLNQSVTYLERHSPNALRSFFDSVTSIQYLVTQHAVQVVIATVLATSSLIVMAVESLALTYTSLALVAVLLITQVSLRFRNMRAKENLFQASVAHDGFVLDSLGVAPALIRYGATSNAMKAHGGLLARVFEAATTDAKVSTLIATSRQTLVHIDRLLFIGIGMYLLQKGTMTFGAFVAFGLYRDLFRSSVDQIATALSEVWVLRFQRLRLAPLLTSEPTRPTGAEIEDGRVRCKDVSFRYTMFEPVILQNFNLCVEPGDFVLIQGPSGIGKSTVARLILGLSTPQTGSIEIDGEAATDSMRGIAGVLQGDSLIAGTIADNILLYRDGFSQEDVENAAVLACAHEFIDQLPMKYHTVMSDRYAGLSAGQRQRLLIARAVLGKPKLLVLDEATSHVDPITESRILDNLAGVQASKIVVSHRKDIAHYADRIITLDRGQAKEDHGIHTRSRRWAKEGNPAIAR